MKALINMEDRIVTIEIDGDQYEMLLSTQAANAISKRYGGIENAPDVLTEDNPNIWEDTYWILEQLINGAISYRNFRADKDNQLLPVTAEKLMARTSPFDNDVSELMMKCMTAGLERNVESESEDDSKNEETA